MTSDFWYKLVAEKFFPNKGNNNLKQLSRKYNNRDEWESRCHIIRQGILKTIGLYPFPKKTPLNPIIHSLKKYDDYSVQNVYFESLPGFFVTGNLYSPLRNQENRPKPAVLIPHGHFPLGRFEPDFQHLGALIARMGGVAFTYDMVGYKLSECNQVSHDAKYTITFQTWNSIRVLDFLLGLEDVDSNQIGITGASGGGTQTFILSAVDERVKLSIPAVMVSSKFYGGCNCESGLPIHKGEGYATNNAEIAAMIAPKPMLLISIGTDWTRFVPIREYPFIKRIYGFYSAESKIENMHFPNEKHNYGYLKRHAAVNFLAKHFKSLILSKVLNPDGSINEKPDIINPRENLLAFDTNHPRPENCLKNEEEVLKKIKELQN